MCGICGILDFNGSSSIDEKQLSAMAKTMTHRGPDDQGAYINPGHCLGLGFRRLSIIDLSPAGHQPMSNEDGTVWIVFNGEIYNHAELRQELEKTGHRFSSHTDTESIIHGYEEWGEGVVDRLRGMFSFAVWDEKRSSLFIARDRIGIKPFYYLHQAGRFIFGSEIKAILACDGVERDVDMEGLYHYLTLAVTPPPHTMFKGIKKLPAGHTLTIEKKGDLKIRQYWDALFPGEHLAASSGEEIPGRLRTIFQESIRLRMMSDVPFGVFLSGGLDSSLNVALMSRLMNRPVDTFSVAIKDDRKSNELSEALLVAEHFKTNHHEIIISSQDFIDFLPRMAWLQDEPLADPVCVPLYFVSKLARDNGTIVVQVGEGSDELFAGYRGNAFMQHFYRRWYAPFASLPAMIKKPVSFLAGLILPQRKAEFLAKAVNNEELFWGGVSVFPERMKKMICREGSFARNFDTYRDVIKKHYRLFDEKKPASAFLDRIIYLEIKQRLAELLLMRVDKMTMAASVEARVPYLDQELVRFALSIPPDMKIKNGVTKYVLKKAARGIVPDFVIDRPKTGFCGSATNMLNRQMVDYSQKEITGSKWMSEIFDAGQIEALLKTHKAGKTDNSMKIWSLLNLVLWHNTYIERKL